MAETSGSSASEVRCPRCGHFTGPSVRCAHCGQHLENSMKIRRLRAAAWLTAIGGLILLHLYAIHRDIPLIRIGDIRPVMNFATVRVQGVLKSDARRTKSGSVLYVIEDGSGTLSVFANPAGENELPQAGSRITVTGSLGVSASQEIRLRVQSPDQIVIEPGVFLPPTHARRLADIDAGQKGDRLTVRGRVAKLWTPPLDSGAPHKLVLADDSASLEVVYWANVADALAGNGPRLGADLEIRGTVDLYREKLQLKVWEAGDIRALE